MAIKLFTFAELEELGGGKVAEALRQALDRAVFDCKDRPGEKTARKVILQAELVPVVDDDGQCDTIEMSFQVKDTVPTRKSMTYNFGLKRGGGLIFSTESPGNFNQGTFGFDGAEDPPGAETDVHEP